jgi:RNA polymerase sigma-70 factor (ECF subfamily)
VGSEAPLVEDRLDRGEADREVRVKEAGTPSSPGAWLEARRAIEDVVHDASGRVLGALVRSLGDFGLAEDALQDAIAGALERWPVDGVPANPAGWIAVSARRRALDRLRRRSTRFRKQDDVLLVERLAREVEEGEPPDIPDERLALVFTCCHPALAEEARVALTLRALCGLSTPEIARCFLVPEATVAQRIVRARRKIQDARIPFQVPDREDLPERLSSVLAVLYLVFNEGYTATSGGLLRADLCEEAIRLARIIVELLPGEAEAEGLLALLLLHDSRRLARTDPTGALVTLEHQDRSRWDRARIDEGRALVRRALERRHPGRYQIEAAISAVHAEAERAADTDWWQIVGLYTALHSFVPTPVVALNRAAALAMAAGPELGLRHLDDPSIADPLDGYHLLHSARADLHRRLGNRIEAARHYRRALDLVTNDAERLYLERRLAEVTRDP